MGTILVTHPLSNSYSPSCSQRYPIFKGLSQQRQTNQAYLDLGVWCFVEMSQLLHQWIFHFWSTTESRIQRLFQLTIPTV